jgi:hypothetical protein
LKMRHAGVCVLCMCILCKLCERAYVLSCK